MRTSKRLQTPFLDKLRHEKIYGEARVRELKQRMRDEEDRQRRQMEETMNGLELDKPFDSFSNYTSGEKWSSS